MCAWLYVPLYWSPHPAKHTILKQLPCLLDYSHQVLRKEKMETHSSSFVGFFFFFFQLTEQKGECCIQVKYDWVVSSRYFLKNLKLWRDMKSIQNQFLKNIWELKFLLKLINLKSPLIIFKKCKYYTGKAE